MVSEALETNFDGPGSNPTLSDKSNFLGFGIFPHLLGVGVGQGGIVRTVIPETLGATHNKSNGSALIKCFCLNVIPIRTIHNINAKRLVITRIQSADFRK